MIEKDYIRTGNEGLIAPLQRFLDGEMKNIMRERKVLENKRLDLDACKNRVRKARSMQDQQQVSHELSTSYRQIFCGDIGFRSILYIIHNKFSSCLGFKVECLNCRKMALTQEQP